MSDHIERPCPTCGTFLHVDCAGPNAHAEVHRLLNLCIAESVVHANSDDFVGYFINTAHYDDLIEASRLVAVEMAGREIVE